MNACKTLIIRLHRFSSKMILLPLYLHVWSGSLVPLTKPCLQRGETHTNILQRTTCSMKGIRYRLPLFSNKADELNSEEGNKKSPLMFLYIVWNTFKILRICNLNIFQFVN